MMTLTLAEAADLLKISADALLRKARAGTVPGARIGRRWVFNQADLLAFIHSLYRQPMPVDRRFNAKANFATSNWRAALLRRTPAWVNLADVYGVYAECARRSKETGVPHHVDHVIPLQGKTVSGLHVASNLRVITARENVRKRNIFDPDLKPARREEVTFRTLRYYVNRSDRLRAREENAEPEQ